MPESHRHLPHFHPESAYLFLTFRLHGSMPAPRPSILYRNAGEAFAAEDYVFGRSSRGPLWLKKPQIASLVEETIVAGAARRGFYELYAWVIMPNHVHLLILPLAPVPQITRWVKGSSAKQANLLLHRTGQAFWQDETYDHWVRNEREFVSIARYIERNPVSAGLCVSPEFFPWSSAGQAEAPVLPRPKP